MHEDAELLRLYAGTHSEDAFGALMQRYLPLVYSAALRQVGGDVHGAKDVTQTVFALLARKAASLQRHPALTGWLYTTTHHTAAKLRRAEQRRRRREEEAQAMHIQDESEAAARDWAALKPVIDDAMLQLKEIDRTAVLLRFFENRSYDEIGARTGLNENTARMRVDRALDSLRGVLARRGIASTAGALGAALSTHAVTVPPAGLAAALATVTTTTAVGGGLALFMSSITLKSGLVTAVVVAGSAGFLLQYWENVRLRAEVEGLRAEVAAGSRQVDNQEGEIARLSQTLLTQVQAIEGEQVYESALALWIGRVRQLTAFLNRYPEMGIPEIALTSEADWLDATKGVSFESEADFRKALAELRRIARGKSSDAIGSALRQAMAANDGNLPADVQALAAYLPPDLDPSILRRFTFNPSGQIKGISSDMRFVLDETPVDELWDSMYFFSNDSVGMRRTMPWGRESHVAAAMAEFEKTTGRPAEASGQLQPYLEDANIAESVRDALFKALNTKPDL